MIKKFIFCCFLIFVFSCNNVEFVFKEKNQINPLKDKTALLIDKNSEEAFIRELYSYFEYLSHGKAVRLNLDICNFFLEGIGKRKIQENIKEVWSVLKVHVGIMRILYIPMNLFQIFRFYR